MRRVVVSGFLGIALAVSLLVAELLSGTACAQSCEAVVAQFNGRYRPQDGIDEAELVSVLRSLNGSGNTKLPPKFVTKKDAKRQGWRPGRDLWSVSGLNGKSIGGDVFSNREGQLPGKRWREADLSYRGGHRGAKRILFSKDGLRMVTVDHYRTFREVPACQ